ncbi:transcriptional regulator [Kaistia sp. 32K]|uniref:LysR family transcriptional regulator n=1 Tax=Kaistia sp. 32K TaxID=2795690 RepID=UPI001916A158|nr:LysR family transcriptional regulator [Kaistia sp. 32K]BCP52795.1 transcriptional regulator [Kaistia sp. 32K]
MIFSSDSIELFLAVIDQGSFSAAARVLHRVPSAVSMAIANLEAELGYALFVREARQVRPTPAALALVPHARVIAEQLEQLAAHATELSDGLETRLAIGIAADIDNARLMHTISDVSARHPLLAIEITTAPQDDVVERLRTGRIDLCIAYGGLETSRKEDFHFIGTETLVAVVSTRHGSELVDVETLKLDDLFHHRQILIASTEHPISDFRQLIAGSYWRTDSLATAVNMVKVGLGWANLPLSVATPLAREGSVRILPFSNVANGLKLPLHLRWMKQNPLGMAGQELLEMLKRG